MNWWFERDGQRGGPVTEAELLSLIAQGDLAPETLIWRDGLPDWTPLRSVQELAFQLPPNPPPPPPPLPSPRPLAPRRPSLQAFEVVQPQERVASADPVPKDNHSQSMHSDVYTTTTPATWYRFFARQIDMCVLGVPVVFLAFFTMSLVGSTALGLRLQDSRVSTLAAIAMLCLLAPLAEAAVSNVFGNTPGKALFGLKVQSIDGRKLSFGEQANRAYLVMAYGLGFYLPFISLFTCISQFNQVKKIGTAGYDTGLFRLRESNLSGRRSLMAVGAWLLSFFVLTSLNAYGKYENSRIASPKSWTNPATQMATTIPGGWDVNSEANVQGQTVHIFTKAGDAIQVVFAAEDVPQNVSMEAYVAAFVRGVKSSMTVSPAGEGATVAGHSAKVHLGEMLSPKTPIEVTFVKRGNVVWRTVVIRYVGTNESFPVAELRTAVFRSVPVQ